MKTSEMLEFILAKVGAYASNKDCEMDTEKFSAMFMSLNSNTQHLFYDYTFGYDPSFFFKEIVHEEYDEEGYTDHKWSSYELITSLPYDGKMPSGWYHAEMLSAGERHRYLPRAELDLELAIHEMDKLYAHMEPLVSGVVPFAVSSIEALSLFKQGKHQQAYKVIGLDGVKAVVDFNIKHCFPEDGPGLDIRAYYKWAGIPAQLIHACIKAFGDVSELGVAIAKYARCNVNDMRKELKACSRKITECVIDEEDGSCEIDLSWIKKMPSWFGMNYTESDQHNWFGSVMLSYASLPDHCILKGYGIILSLNLINQSLHEDNARELVSTVYSMMGNVHAEAVYAQVQGSFNVHAAIAMASEVVDAWDHDSAIWSLLTSGLTPDAMEASHTMPDFSITIDGFTFKRMPKNSKYQLRVGDFSACCQSLDGAASTLIPVILLDDTVDNYYVIDTDGVAVADVVIWKGLDYYVVDSMESRKCLPEDVFCKLVRSAIKYFDMPLVANKGNTMLKKEDMSEAKFPCCNPLTHAMKAAYRDTTPSDNVRFVLPLTEGVVQVAFGIK